MVEIGPVQWPNVFFIVDSHLNSGHWDTGFELRFVHYVFKWFRYLNVWYSDLHCIKMMRYLNLQLKKAPMLQIFYYIGDLKSNLVWISNGPKEVGLEMIWILNGIWNPVAQPYEIRTNGGHFVK